MTHKHNFTGTHGRNFGRKQMRFAGFLLRIPPIIISVLLLERGNILPLILVLLAIGILSSLSRAMD